MKTYRLYDYDVWGNENDGYDVNDVFKTNELYKIDANWSDSKLISALKKQGLIKKGIHQSSIEIGGDDMTITFDYKGKPEFELRIEE